MNYFLQEARVIVVIGTLREMHQPIYTQDALPSRLVRQAQMDVVEPSNKDGVEQCLLPKRWQLSRAILMAKACLVIVASMDLHLLHSWTYFSTTMKAKCVPKES